MSSTPCSGNVDISHIWDITSCIPSAFHWSVKKSNCTKHFMIFEDLRGHWERSHLRVLSIVAHLPLCPILFSLLVPSPCLLHCSCPSTHAPVFLHPTAVPLPLLRTQTLGASYLPKAFPHKN